MYLMLDRNDDFVLAALVERRVTEVRRMLGRIPYGEAREEFERELAALVRILHRLNEACYDVTC